MNHENQDNVDIKELEHTNYVAITDNLIICITNKQIEDQVSVGVTEDKNQLVVLHPKAVLDLSGRLFDAAVKESGVESSIEAV